tara:strand:- start:1830 stop:3185 length:1356 start_codon:yes stop_codon:yes gene_type:complete
MTTGLFTEIINELKEKASTIPGKLLSSFSMITGFLKKFTTEPFNYAVLQSLIYITLIVVIILRDPYDLRDSRPLQLTMSMLFLFFLMFITYFFIDHRKQHNLSSDNGLWKIFFKKFFSMIAFALALIGLILLGLYIIKRVPQITNITAFIFRTLVISGIVAIGYILYKKYSKSNVPDKKNRFIKLLQDIILYLPCLIIEFVEFIKKQWNLTTKTEWLILGGEIVVIGLGFVLPIVYQKLVTHDGVILIDKPKYLSSKYELGTYQNLTPADNSGEPFKYSYSISGWFNIFGMAPNMRASANEFTDIINYSNKPRVQFNVSTNTLRIQTEISHHMHRHGHSPSDNHHDEDKLRAASTGSKTVDVFVTDKIELQKWNNIVINYDSGYMDVFLNGVLVGTKGTVSPYMKYDVVSSGANRGIEGGICNVVYYDRILSKGEIDINYKLLRGVNTPLF